jgi:hypothetical protein
MAIKGRFPAIRPSLDLNFAKTKRLDPRITFTRASSGTYVGRDGLIKTAGVNEPRFDHNPTTGESLGLLVEEARTNLLPYSEDFSQADWVTFGTASKSSNVATAPDGNFTADSITLPAASGVLDNIPVSASTTYTFSVYIRGTPGTTIRILSNANSSGLVANTVTVSGVWQRYSVTFTTNSGDISTSIQFDSGGGNTFYVWGAQVEAGAFPTSYIPTVAATVTRAADVASITGSGDGTSGLYLWGAQLEVGSAVTPYIQSPSVFTSRASSGTYVGGNGLIQTAVTNLLLRSEEFDNSRRRPLLTLPERLIHILYLHKQQKELFCNCEYLQAHLLVLRLTYLRELLRKQVQAQRLQ